MRLDHLLSKEKVGVVLLSGFQVSLEETGEARQRLRTDKINIIMVLVKGRLKTEKEIEVRN